MSSRKEIKLADAIVTLIRETPVLAGDRLPAERVLAHRFAASRHTLRSALRRLEARGILTIRPGSGCYVQSTAGLSPGDAFSVPRATPETIAPILEEHLEARWALEPSIGAVAAAKATAQDHGALADALTRISRAMMTGDSTKLAEGYGHFQRRVAAATRNPVLEEIGRQLAVERQRLAAEQTDIDLRDQEALFSAAVAVVKAVEQGDPQRTRQRIRDLVRQDGRLLKLPPECALAAFMRHAPTPQEP